MPHLLRRSAVCLAAAFVLIAVPHRPGLAPTALAGPIGTDGPVGPARRVGPVGPAGPVGIQGAGCSRLYVQNLDEVERAAAVATFFRQGGAQPVDLSFSGIAARAARLIELSAFPQLSNGAYAAIVSADHRTASMSRLEWPQSGAALEMNQPTAGTDVLVQLVLKHVDPLVIDASSLLSFQNTDAAVMAQVTVDLIRSGDRAPLWTQDYAVPGGSSWTLDLGKDPAFAAIPNGFVGTARLRSLTPFAVNAAVNLEATAFGVYGFEAAAAEAAGPRVYAPVVRAGWQPPYSDPALGTMDSFVSVANAGDVDADVTVTYQGTEGSCAGQTVRHGGKSYPVAAHSNLLFYQGAEGATAATGPSGLPAGCSATAVIEAPAGRLAAAVVLNQGPRHLAAAYTAFAEQALGHSAALPSVQRTRTGFAAELLSSDVVAMNASPSPAAATLALFDVQGTRLPCPSGCTAVIPPLGSHRWWLPDLAAMPDGSAGSAVVSSDQPVAAVVARYPVPAKGDMAMYGGVNADAPGGGPPGPPGPALSTNFAPILPRDGCGTAGTLDPWPALPATPTPTSGPSPTPVSSATPTRSATATATAGATVTASMGATATVVPPTGSGSTVSRNLRSSVPQAVLDQALANPERVSGYNQLERPSLPPGPYNRRRSCLTLQNPNLPYHPLFNSLVFRASCQ